MKSSHLTLVSVCKCRVVTCSTWELTSLELDGLLWGRVTTFIRVASVRKCKSSHLSSLGIDLLWAGWSSLLPWNIAFVAKARKDLFSFWTSLFLCRHFYLRAGLCDVSPFRFERNDGSFSLPRLIRLWWGTEDRWGAPHLHVASAWIDWLDFLFMKRVVCWWWHYRNWNGGSHLNSERRWWVKKEFAVSTLVPSHVEWLPLVPNALYSQMTLLNPCGQWTSLGHRSYGALSRRWGLVLCEVVDWPSFGCLRKDLWWLLLNLADWVCWTGFCSIELSERS